MNASISLLIARYIHKLNGLIGAIRTEVYLIKETTGLLEQEPQLSRALDSIEESANNLLALADDFKLSVNEPNEQDCVLLKELLEQAVKNEMPNNIELKLVGFENIPKVQVSQKVEEVFHNLITNAYEAMADKGGTLNIQADMNSVSKTVEISFTDTGRGMQSFIVQSLFQPYFSTKSENGHGLGLWWSRLYIESMGGSLDVKWSKVGQGTKMLVSIPVTTTDKTKTH
jgi:signal transduction histidine kinase